MFFAASLAMTSTPSSKAVFRAATSPVSAARSIAFTALLFAIVDWFAAAANATQIEKKVFPGKYSVLGVLVLDHYCP